jgi:hypothetical protein
VKALVIIPGIGRIEVPLTRYAHGDYSGEIEVDCGDYGVIALYVNRNRD